MKIFSGSSNRVLSEKVAKEMDLELSSVDMHVFPDGEKRIRIPESILDQDTVIIQSAATPVDQNYMELFFVIDALRRNGAKSVTAVVPYFGYQRQDHVFRDGEAVSLEVVISMLESVKVDRLVTFDLHSVKIPDLFHIPVSHLSALPAFVQQVKENKWNTKDTVLVSPDIGGLRGIKKFSALLGNMDYVVLKKRRDLATGAVSSEDIMEGSLKNKKRAILLDDMISSGSTIIVAAEVLQQHGIKDIAVFATHPVFSVNAPFILQNSILSHVFVSDTVRISSAKRFEKLTIVSVAKEVSRELTRMLTANKRE